MRTIVKHYVHDEKPYPSEFFLINELNIEYRGALSNKTFNLILLTGAFKEVDHIEIIEIFWRHSILTADCKFCKYYEIK